MQIVSYLHEISKPLFSGKNDNKNIEKKKKKKNIMSSAEIFTQHAKY